MLYICIHAKIGIGVSKKLHIKQDKPEAKEEHKEPGGAVGVQQEVSTTQSEAEQNIGVLGVGPIGLGPRAPRPF